MDYLISQPLWDYWYSKKSHSWSTERQGRQNVALAPTTGVHLFQRIQPSRLLLPSSLLWQVNRSPVSSMFCSAELCSYSVCQEVPLCPCCQIRPGIWLRARSTVLRRNQAEKLGCVSINPNITAPRLGSYIKRRPPPRMGGLWNKLERLKVLKICDFARNDNWIGSELH